MSTKENLTCDICGYTHPRDDSMQEVVSEYPDGIIRCNKCARVTQGKDRHKDDKINLNLPRWREIEE